VPSFNIGAPLHYYSIDKIERESRSVLTSDTCVIDGSVFYAKGFLEIPVKGLKDTLSFSAWVSLSEENFLKFEELWEVENASLNPPMFGWLSSDIFGFGDCINLKSRLIFQDNNWRPNIELEPTDHPLSIAYHRGIPQEKLIEIFSHYLHIWS
jgi:hypothetical protein